jgi:predicted ester cyclase
MLDHNKAAARRLLEDIISRGDLAEVAEIVSADYHEHDPVNEVDTRGADGMREEFEMFRAAFGLQFKVEDQIAEGDQVASRWSARGTHAGEFMGVAPTGEEIAITGITIFRFADGMIEEGWWNWDTLGMLRRIGAVPAEQPA